MEKTVVLCDMCSKPDAAAFSFAVDSQMDGAGDSDTIHDRVDLCPLCQRKQLENFIAALPWTARKVLVRNIMKDKTFYLAHMSRAERLHGLGE